MNIRMHQCRLIVLGIGFILFSLITMNTMASGTFSPGGSGGNDYQLSKVIFYKKVVCSSCPYSGRGKDAQDAQALIQEIKADAASSQLSSKQQRSAVSYLKRRFRLKGQ